MAPIQRKTNSRGGLPAAVCLVFHGRIGTSPPLVRIGNHGAHAAALRPPIRLPQVGGQGD